VLACLFLILFHLCGFSLTRCLVVCVHFLAFALDLTGNLFVNLDFAVGLSLSFTSLRHEHFPAANIVHGLILMSEQVAFNKWAVAHSDSASCSLEGTLTTNVSQSDLRGSIFPVLLICCGYCARNALTAYFVSLSPVGKLGRLDNHAGEELTECVQ
jgi:hypothetical protein